MGVIWAPKQRCLLPHTILVLVYKGTPQLAITSMLNPFTFGNHTLPKFIIWLYLLWAHFSFNYLSALSLSLYMLLPQSGHISFWCSLSCDSSLIAIWKFKHCFLEIEQAVPSIPSTFQFFFFLSRNSFLCYSSSQCVP